MIFPLLKMYGYCRVLDNLKDYAVRALVNAVDHLGTVAYKLTDIFDQQSSDVAALDYKVSSLNQVISMPFVEEKGSNYHNFCVTSVPLKLNIK
jgi:hypothetical protein